jgi:hypothetical protein
MAKMETTIFVAVEKIARTVAAATTTMMIPATMNQATTVLDYSRWQRSLPLAD